MSPTPGLPRAIPAAVTLTLVLLGCSDSDPVGPDLVPAEIVLVSGDDQAGIVGEGLDEALVVRVETSDGRPVPDVTVTWTADAGTVAGSGPTDAEGIASATWQLGTQPGIQSATASVTGVDSREFTANASEWYFEFEYSGARSGTFRALGRAELDDEGRFMNEGSFVFGIVSEASDADTGSGTANQTSPWWSIAAFDATDFPFGDIALFDVDGEPEPGDYDLFDEVFGLVDFDLELVDGELHDTESTVLHDFVSGTLTLAGVTETTLTGTFEGQAEDIEDDSNVLTITNGRFHAPIVENAGAAEADAAAASRTAGSGEQGRKERRRIPGRELRTH